ncbi:LysR family transcriptional regulator [Pandoraea communis]|uniref:LysR family transcriptional regulator n=1 Tax=Pandoraea communis TaxID=2508297 RepID=UPI0025A5B454|nr:LysR family transcriptional regulator [Pandoraea communis]MDM8357707.1 LysR family transcriptional regulator [Pandoraea communis]
MDKIDLKHMRIFLQLVREKSASRVAHDAGISQQAVSGYLRRLRDAFPREIFLRHSSGLEPTEFALGIARKFEQIVADVDDVLQAEVFDPRSLNRWVTVIANEYAQLSIVPKLLAKIRQLAPDLKVRIVDFDRRSHAKRLADGDVELAIGFSTFVDDSLPRISLIDEHYCCVAGERSEIARAVRSPVDLAGFAYVDFADSASYSGNAVERFLAANDVPLCTPVATLACYTSLRPFLEHNDVVAFVPSAVASACQFKRIEFEVKPDSFSVVVAWHRRTSGSALGQWLRDLVRECVGGASSTPNLR